MTSFVLFLQETKDLRTQLENVTKECQRLNKENNALNLKIKESGDVANANMRELVMALEAKGVIDRDTRNKLGERR